MLTFMSVRTQIPKFSNSHERKDSGLTSPLLPVFPCGITVGAAVANTASATWLKLAAKNNN